ncbi:GNAT family N-acetyltransferase [Methylocystis hirsuta]|uniref:GNAT family N-acetyltransferase n=2 Tax=Methylocystis hirsuta TaxID=369798 RepID=A0A3M9XS24_9HYPH|nr:GNAT family N-acetyltransferase [Methylocystis hirsuta]
MEIALLGNFLMKYDLIDVQSPDDWKDYHFLRRTVLWEAKGRHNYNENHADERVKANHPLLLKLHDRPIGAVRLDEAGDCSGVVRLVSIAPDVQRSGHGSVLSSLIEAYARRLGITTLLVNAAPDAVGFYEKMGWKKEMWDESELRGLASDCVQMTKNLH